ncbi:hypothetical protein [Bacillus massilinigeriensis]|uniref:hypothetical protein n=1 Tax=Bacillus mediterraneensis TaxID=1805474 RepID=UPI0008F86E7C|nr:hypothetical protein [Bacillus mediterraneensis]
MEDLLGNPIIIAIIIGMVSSFFGKKKENSKTEDPRRKEAKSTDKGQMQQRYADTKKSAAKAKQVDSKRPVSTRTKQNAAKLDGIAKPTEQTASELIIRDSRLVKEPSSTVKYIKPELKKDGDSLLSGLIWAEVLGPPRARKPHKSRR